MKTKTLAVFTFLALCIVFAGSALGSDIRYAFFGAGRYHAENEFSPVAFEDGKWSAMAGLEIYEGAGYWQFAVDFADAGGTGTVSSVITPQINLNVNDGGVVAGVGVLYSYVKDDALGNDWSDIYFQLNGGLDMALGDSLSLRGIAHFVFKDWGDIGEIDFDKIDYTVGLHYKF